MFLLSLKSAARAILKYPSLFLVAVIPEGIMAVVQTLTEDFSEKSPIRAIVLIFPFFCISSSMSGTLCYLILNEERARRIPQLNRILERLWERFPALILLSIVTGLIFLLGLLAVILPFIFFMTLYSFAPLLLYQDEKKHAAKDVFIYLARSSSLARKAFWTTGLVAFLGTGLGFVSYLASKSFGSYLGGLVEGASSRDAIALAFEITLAMLTGAFSETLLASYFFTLQNFTKKINS